MDWTSAVVVRETDRVWETWPIGQRERGGDVYWKTFLSSDLTESTDMTMGVLKIPVDSCRNTEAVDLRFGYVFPADSFKQIEYVFD